MRLCSWLLFGLCVACNGSRSGSGPPILASVAIGPEGGVITVDTGVQAGLRLTIPAGALIEPELVRIRDLTPLPTPGMYNLSILPPPGQPFLIEPSGLHLEQLATLRVPYRTMFVFETGPGNVRLRQVRNDITIDFEPTAIDVGNGYLELPIRHFARYQVVQGLRVQLASYWPVTGTAVALADGFTFAVEEVPGESPFATPTARRWRIAGPQDTDLLYFDDEQLRGRESLTADWREIWNESYPVWTHLPVATSVGALTTTTAVHHPMSGLPIGGQMTVSGSWNWTGPRSVGERLLLDVVLLRVNLAWNRWDLGVGQRQYSFWFAPGVGLIAFGQDGVVHGRLTL
ncbi:MAG TPA: hypothetical protein VFD82_13230 [Planctomycetota bacterium]|nr:hypothetical protein [Planctomycetota bacterium]